MLFSLCVLNVCESGCVRAFLRFVRVLPLCVSVYACVNVCACVCGMHVRLAAASVVCGSADMARASLSRAVSLPILGGGAGSLGNDSTEDISVQATLVRGSIHDTFLNNK